MDDHYVVRYAIKIMLTALIEKRETSIYYFNEKYKLSPNVIVSCMLYLKNEDLVSYNAEEKFLTLNTLSVEKQALINFLLKNKRPDLSRKIDFK